MCVQTAVIKDKGNTREIGTIQYINKSGPHLLGGSSGSNISQWQLAHLLYFISFFRPA
jgi:hypothetical protein